MKEKHIVELALSAESKKNQ